MLSHRDSDTGTLIGPNATQTAARLMKLTSTLRPSSRLTLPVPFRRNPPFGFVRSEQVFVIAEPMIMNDQLAYSLGSRQLH